MLLLSKELMFIQFIGQKLCKTLHHRLKSQHHTSTRVGVFGYPTTLITYHMYRKNIDY